jgi:hypothetical protein
MEKISCMDGVRNKEAVIRVNEERNVIYQIKEGLTGCVIYCLKTAF